MRENHGLRLSGLLVALGVASLLPARAHAAPLTFSVDLRTGVGDPAVPPYITYESLPQDTNGDGYFETVLRINLNDPSINNPYVSARFQVVYDAPPGGVTVNIGDSRTNDCCGGDGGTQTNDAEINIGRPDIITNRLQIFGNDNFPSETNILNFSGDGVVANLTVANEFFAWDNNQGVSGSLQGPSLFALAGQPDSEGPVNYDIFAAFNRVIAGTYRLGSGAASVTVTLVPIPEPNSLALLFSGLVGLVLVARLRARRGSKAGSSSGQGRAGYCEVAG